MDLAAAAQRDGYTVVRGRRRAPEHDRSRCWPRCAGGSGVDRRRRPGDVGPPSAPELLDGRTTRRSGTCASTRPLYEAFAAALRRRAASRVSQRPARRQGARRGAACGIHHDVDPHSGAEGLRRARLPHRHAGRARRVPLRAGAAPGRAGWLRRHPSAGIDVVDPEGHDDRPRARPRRRHRAVGRAAAARQQGENLAARARASCSTSSMFPHGIWRDTSEGRRRSGAKGATGSTRSGAPDHVPAELTPLGRRLVGLDPYD